MVDAVGSLQLTRRHHVDILLAWHRHRLLLPLRPPKKKKEKKKEKKKDKKKDKKKKKENKKKSSSSDSDSDSSSDGKNPKGKLSKKKKKDDAAAVCAFLALAVVFLHIGFEVI